MIALCWQASTTIVIIKYFSCYLFFAESASFCEHRASRSNAMLPGHNTLLDPIRSPPLILYSLCIALETNTLSEMPKKCPKLGSNCEYYIASLWWGTLKSLMQSWKSSSSTQPSFVKLKLKFLGKNLGAAVKCFDLSSSFHSALRSVYQGLMATIQTKLRGYRMEIIRNL